MSATASLSPSSLRRLCEKKRTVSRTPGRRPTGYREAFAIATIALMLADTLMTAGAAFVGLVGGTLVLMIVLHVYASWTLREIDQDSERQFNGAAPESN